MDQPHPLAEAAPPTYDIISMSSADPMKSSMTGSPGDLDVEGVMTLLHPWLTTHHQLVYQQLKSSGCSKVDLHFTVNLFRAHLQTYLHTYTTGQDRGEQLTQQTCTAVKILAVGVHTEQLRLSLTLYPTVR